MNSVVGVCLDADSVATVCGAGCCGVNTANCYCRRGRDRQDGFYSKFDYQDHLDRSMCVQWCCVEKKASAYYYAPFSPLGVWAMIDNIWETNGWTIC